MVFIGYSVFQKLFVILKFLYDFFDRFNCLYLLNWFDIKVVENLLQK